MSAFKDLLIQAKRAGVKYISFDVDLETIEDSCSNDERWQCWAGSWADYENGSVPIYRGHSGEEALRRLVASLDRSSDG